MNRDEIAALKSAACLHISALGFMLDSLQLVDGFLANPGDPFSDAVIAAQHIEEAAATADTLAQQANDIAMMLDRHHAAVLQRVRALEQTGGGA